MYRIIFKYLKINIVFFSLFTNYCFSFNNLNNNDLNNLKGNLVNENKKGNLVNENNNFSNLINLSNNNISANDLRNFYLNRKKSIIFSIINKIENFKLDEIRLEFIKSHFFNILQIIISMSDCDDALKQKLKHHYDQYIKHIIKLEFDTFRVILSLVILKNKHTAIDMMNMNQSEKILAHIFSLNYLIKLLQGGLKYKDLFSTLDIRQNLTTENSNDSNNNVLNINSNNSDLFISNISDIESILNKDINFEDFLKDIFRLCFSDLILKIYFDYVF